MGSRALRRDSLHGNERRLGLLLVQRVRLRALRSTALRRDRWGRYRLAAIASQLGCCFPARLAADSATRAAPGAAAKDVAGGDELHPKRTVAFVVRGGAGLTQRIQAALLRTRRGSGESGQLEDHPRAGIQFLDV